jgi:hypothetical protein
MKLRVSFRNSENAHKNDCIEAKNSVQESYQFWWYSNMCNHFDTKDYFASCICIYIKFC